MSSPKMLFGESANGLRFKNANKELNVERKDEATDTGLHHGRP